jgi:hypothetical protein
MRHRRGLERVVREEKRGGGANKMDATNKEVGASTEIRIAPKKTFAAPSKKDDASAEKIE